jgi:protein-tyrosine kinase
MSRVFDALHRAHEEKKEPVQRTETPSPVSNQQIVTRNEPESTSSWRERLDNFFFGWNASRLKSYPVVALEENSPAAEQYKILREQVKKLRTDTGARCLSVTSPVQRDGKTTVAVNLAAAMALDYEGRVLLIDCDLRRPEAHRYFGIGRSPGLADYLSSSGNGNLMSYVKETFVPGLKFIPGGNPSKLSSELLAKQRMTSLMEEIRTTFAEHQIILDTPPVLSTPDPLVLGKHVDGIIMTVRAGKTQRDYVVKAIRSLNSTKLMGIVLNGVDLQRSTYYYSYPVGRP